MMLDQADIVVVGGGVTGFSTAYALKKRSFDVIVVEQRFAAFGASGRNSGCLWLQTASGGGELELTRRGSEMYAQLRDELGDTFEYRRTGGVFFYETDEQQRQLAAYVEDRRAAGVATEFITREDAVALSPLVPESALGAVFSPDDAQIDTAKFTRALADACRRSGVRVYENTPALGLIWKGGTAAGIRTVRGDVDAGGVVWATGAWSAGLVDEVQLPITPARVGMLVTQPTAPVARAIARGPKGVFNARALTSLPQFDPTAFGGDDAERAGLDFEDVAVQRQDGSFVVGHTWEFASSLNPHITLDATNLMTRTILARRPEYGRLGVVGLWAGLVGVTPDNLPIIDRIDGLFVNTGHSFGAASGPISGELTAQMITGENPTMQPGDFAYARDSLIEHVGVQS